MNDDRERPPQDGEESWVEVPVPRAPSVPASAPAATASGDDNALCRAMVQQAPQAFLLFDLDGRVVRANDAAAELLGRDLDSLCAMELAQIETDVGADGLEERWVRLASGAPISLDTSWQRKDGRAVPVGVQFRFVEEGGRRYVLCSASLRLGEGWEHKAGGSLESRGEHFRSVLEHSGCIFLLVDRDGRLIDVNEFACQTLGYEREELLSLQMSEIDEAMVRARIGFLWKQVAPDTSLSVEAVLRRKDGSSFPARVQVGRLRSRNRDLLFLLASDLSEQRRVEHELRRSNEQLKSWVEELEQRSREMGQINELGELLQVCQSPAEAYRVISRSARTLFTGDSGAVYVLNQERQVLEAVAAWGEAEPTERVFGPDDCWSLRRGRLHVETRREGGLTCPHVTTTPSGGYLCMPLVGQGETMGLLHLRFHEREGHDNGVGRHLRGAKERLAVTIADQISLALANLNLRETLRTQAIRDPLTGLFNRRYMEESLERELHRAARKGVPLGIIMLDIDHFKRVNDNLGHAAGDAVLREFGAFLRSQVRGEDIACRYGGEEFVLILLDSSLDHTVDRAEGMRASVADLDFQTRQQGLGPITASLGVAAVPEHGATKHTLVGAADAALYAAKNDGRNRVRVAQFNR